MSTILYDKFEMPDAIKVDLDTETDVFSRFIAEPLERGFGHTLGNALRRLLLTSIESPAIISFFMEGVLHEYMAIEGVEEDVTHIVLNLKESLLRYHSKSEIPSSREPKVVIKDLDITQEMLADQGKVLVTLGDLMEGSDYEVVNPEHVIFTVTKPLTRRIVLKVAPGRGYIPSERHVVDDRQVNEIVLDSIFSPVKLVNYFVEDTRVGQDTDFDRLVLDVTTDGRITPREAISFSAKILTKHLSVFESMDEREVSFEKPVDATDSDRDELMQKLILGINEIELSVRSANCLQLASIDSIGELVLKTEADLLKFRNFGRKSLNEIKAKLSEMGLSLGMNLHRFEIDDKNIKTKLQEYLEEQKDAAQ